MKRNPEKSGMKTYTAVVERDPDTGLFVGYVPGFPGAHSQGKTLDELNTNLHEVVAMLQHLRGAKQRGESPWRVFWLGGQPEGAEQDERTPELAQLPRKARELASASVWGMTVPWTLVLSSAIGVFLMAVPGTLNCV